MKNQPIQALTGTAPHPNIKTQLGGIGFMLAMTVCFSSLDASAKFVTSELSLWMVMWGRYFFHFLFIVVLLLPGARKAERRMILTLHRRMDEWLRTCAPINLSRPQKPEERYPLG